MLYNCRRGAPVLDVVRLVLTKWGSTWTRHWKKRFGTKTFSARHWAAIACGISYDRNVGGGSCGGAGRGTGADHILALGCGSDPDLPLHGASRRVPAGAAHTATEIAHCAQLVWCLLNGSVVSVAGLFASCKRTGHWIPRTSFGLAIGRGYAG